MSSKLTRWIDPVSVIKRHGLKVLAIALLSVAAMSGAVSLGATSVSRVFHNQLSDWARENTEAETVEISGIDLGFDLQSFSPVARINGLALADQAESSFAIVPEALAVFDLDQLVLGRLIPKSLVIPGIEIHISRDADGSLSVGIPIFPSFAADGEASSAITALLESLRTGALSHLKSLRVEDVRLIYTDSAATRSFELDGGSLHVENLDEHVRGVLLFDEPEATAAPWRLIFEIPSTDNADVVEIIAKAENIPTATIAEKVGLSTMLGRLDARFDGEMSFSFGSDARFPGATGNLSLSSGVWLSPRGTTYAFDSVDTNLNITPGFESVSLSQLILKAGTMSLEGAAKFETLALFVESSNEITSSFELTGTAVPLPTFPGYALEELRVNGQTRLLGESYDVEFADLLFRTDGIALSAGGGVDFGENGPDFDLQVDGEAIQLDPILRAWPELLAPEAKSWIQQNVTDGIVHRLTGGIQASAASPMRFDLGWEFEAGSILVTEGLPPVQGAAGIATMTDSAFHLLLDKGTISPAGQSPLDLSGTDLGIPGFLDSSTRAHARLRLRAPVPAAIALLRSDGLGNVIGADTADDFAQGNLTGTADLKFSLLAEGNADGIEIAASGMLKDISSTQIIPGKTFESTDLKFEVRDNRIVIGGEAHIGGQLVNGYWESGFGPEHQGNSQASGKFILSGDALEEFGIGLPKGMISGQQEARIDFTILKDGQADFYLESPLDGLEIVVSELNWKKTAGSRGRLEVTGKIAETTRFDSLRLEADGLLAEGRVELDSEGNLSGAAFSRVRVDNWLDAPVRIEGSNADWDYAVTGGIVDFRGFDIGGMAAGADAKTILLRPARLIFAENIILEDFDGVITTGSEYEGRFSGKINGTAPITGELRPSDSGVAATIRSGDAGAVLGAVGAISNLYGGQLTVSLMPGQKSGQYEGAFRIRDTRAIGMPPLSELLNLMSVVGLVETLRGEGIRFATAEGQFVLARAGFVIRKGRASGPSLGLTFSGGINRQKGEVQINGAVSPIYVLNGLFDQLNVVPGIFNEEKGQGVFAFNYVIEGDLQSPRVTVDPISGVVPGILRRLVTPFTSRRESE